MLPLNRVALRMRRPLPMGTEMCVSRVVNFSSLHIGKFAVLGNMNSLTFRPLMSSIVDVPHC